ncbi:MAG: hypothetical protein HQK92_14045, partial [Nitrospirae bacterium]|nr:hypothetical protein [Nitrospirota bacterium]
FLKLWANFSSKYSESFLKSIFTKDLILRLPHFFGIILLNLTVGLIVGAIAGASGSISAGNFVVDALNNSNVTGVILTTPIFAIQHIIVSGGFGGVGSGGGFFALFFILIMIIIQAIIIGIISGILISALQGLLFGVIKGVSYSFFKSFVLVKYELKDFTSFNDIVIQSMKEGVKTGAIVGFIVGTLQGIFTLIGIIKS